MELELVRAYFPKGTNGEIYHDGMRICYSIELPWVGNQHIVSCIPEGKYEMKKRFSEKFGEHLHITDVPGRTLILIHPANDALIELGGCIAPVSILTSEGKGIRSRIAFGLLKSLVIPELENNHRVFITLKSEYV